MNHFNHRIIHSDNSPLQFSTIADFVVAENEYVQPVIDYPRPTHIRTSSSRLQRPQTIVYRDSLGNIVTERPTHSGPVTISSAISLGRHVYSHSSSNGTDSIGSDSASIDISYDDFQEVYYPHEEAVDINAVLDEDVSTTRSNTHLSLLPFTVIYDNCDSYNSDLRINDILENNRQVFNCERQDSLNILLSFTGWDEKYSKYCNLTNIILKNGFFAPNKEGMIFTSNNPIRVEDTKSFDNFNKNDYERYMKNIQNDADPVQWFDIGEEKNVTVVNMNDISCKHVLIKILRSENGSKNMDLQFLGLIGYSGPRAFPFARIV